MTVAAMPLHRITDNHRALKAFLAIGISTVEEFQRTPKQTLLEVAGFGERTYTAVLERINALQADTTAIPDLFPDNLLDYPFENLHLSPVVLEGLGELGIHTLRGAFSTPESSLIASQKIGTEGVNRVKQELARIVQVGTAQVSIVPPAEINTFADFYEALTHALGPEQANIFEARIGLAQRPQRRLQLAVKLKVSEDDLREIEVEIHDILRQQAAGLLARIRDEMQRELKAFEGVVTGEHLAPGTILHAAAQESGDHDLPLRLAAFCCHEDFHLSGNILCDVPRERFTQLRKELRNLTQSSKLPVAITEIEQGLRHIVDPVPCELVLHIIREQFHLAVHIDEKLGEVIAKRSDSVSDRIQEIIEEIGNPVHIDQLMFDYRDRHRSCSHSRLIENLRADMRFIEVDKATWSLRERHVDELEIARVEAERMSSVIKTVGGRHSVYELAEDEQLSDHTACLIVDTLRRDPSLRDLGCSEFAPRHMTSSTAVSDLTLQLKRAMGELPISRFLQNQPESRRRLVSTLLNKNRLFISPGPDRVDLLENYPYDPERMRQMLIAVDTELDSHSGYATLDKLHIAVEAIGLSGGWLTDHLLLDLLRRHGQFEFLPGGIVAKASLGLVGWIQQRAREAIRASYEHSLTARQVLAEEPGLATFEACLSELLDRDPLLQSPDGLHYEVI